VLLAIDVGNSNTVLGLFAGDHLTVRWRLTTERGRMPDEWWALLFPLLQTAGIAPSAIDGAIIDSSVPIVTVALRQMVDRYLRRRPLVVSIDLDLGIRARVDNPREVGPDRLVNAVAAWSLYPCPAVVIDFGTATTFDVVSVDGDFIGGAIVPGLALSFEALTNRAAMLYAVELRVPERAIGTNTITNMQSGVVLGYIGLVEGLIARMTAELGVRPTVIATGGLAGIIAAATAAIDHHVPDLTLQGLRLVYERQRRLADEPSAAT
jgi:type III pantothenate kinase